MQYRRQCVISLDAARLVISSIFLVALLCELLLGRPRPRPYRWVFCRNDVFKRGWAGPRPALNQAQVLARSQKIGLRTEVGHIDDEGIALPVAARVAVPLAAIGRQVRAPVHDDIPLPPLPLAHVVE